MNRDMQSWHALPVRNEFWLCQRSYGMTTPVRRIAMPDAQPDDTPSAPRIFVDTRGLTAVVQGRNLELVTPDGLVRAPLGLPEDMSAVDSVAFHDGLIYVGGRSEWEDTSRLGWFDLSSLHPRWHALEPPPDIVGDVKKPIYSLLVDQDRLIALDGGFTPKLAIFYDLAQRQAPSYRGHVRIPSGINDEPISADVGRTYAAILTAASHDEGQAWKIGIFDRRTMDEVSTFYHHVDWSSPLEAPRQIRMLDDLLLIAHEAAGLGVVRLEDQQPTAFPDVPVVRPWSNAYLPVDAIEYLSPLGQGRVIDVEPLPHEAQAYLTVQRGKQMWWEEIELR